MRGAASIAGPALLAAWLLSAPSGAGAAVPHLELDVRLDPASREFSATAVLTGLQGRAFTLDPGLGIRRMSLDGRSLSPADLAQARGRVVYRAQAEAPPRRLALEYGGRLAPMREADHRQVLGRLPAGAGAEGSFLPAGTGWYPDPGEPFTYRLRLTLPKGQKGLVPGNLVRESEAAAYTAQFDFPHPIEGIDLMAGPWEVAERMIEVDGSGPVRIRTWFHPELAGLAPGYLADAARYIERYSRLIGPYPFKDFGVVSGPLPTGFGMPSLTYLGREVLRLPFVRATSLGHEVLHNWWGNGVYPDWARGNWSEGLTTFLADYAYKEDESADAARQMRLAWLRDLAAVPESEDTALRDFTARRHGISSIVGYNKSAMVFLMLRDRIGGEAFERGLRLIWERHRFRTAGWADLERAFSEAAGRDLSGFFRQWVERAGAPRLRLAGAEAAGGQLRLTLEQTGEPYALSVPIGLRMHPDRLELRQVALSGRRASVSLPVSGRVQAVELDPDFRLWRRLDAAQLPPILREVFVAPRPGLVLADEGAAWRAAGRQLAGRVLDGEPVPWPARGSAPGDATPLLVLGSQAGVARLLERLGLPPKPPELAGRGTAQVWAGRDGNGRAYAVVSADDADALAALGRRLPHYGRQSWLSFEGGQVLDQGAWPVRPERIPVTQRGG